MRFDRNGAAFLSPVALPIFQPSGPHFTGFEPPALAPVLEELEELPGPLGAAHGFPAASLVSAPHIPPLNTAEILTGLGYGLRPPALYGFGAPLRPLGRSALGDRRSLVSSCRFAVCTFVCGGFSSAGPTVPLSSPGKTALNPRHPAPLGRKFQRSPLSLKFRAGEGSPAPSGVRPPFSPGA